MLKLIILDIDETLMSSISAINARKAGIKIKPDRVITVMGQKVYLYKRPYLDKFLDYLRKNFDYIGLWSHGTNDWVEMTIKYILPPDYPLLFAKGRKGLLSRERHKPLTFVWELFKNKGISPKNTIMIEDTIENCELNPRNCLEVPPYRVWENPLDINLLMLREYLKIIKSGSSDIRKINLKKWKEDVISQVIGGKIPLSAF